MSLKPFKNAVRYLDNIEDHNLWPRVEQMLCYKRGGKVRFAELRAAKNETMKYLHRASDDFTALEVGKTSDTPTKALVFFHLCRCRVDVAALLIAYLIAKGAADPHLASDPAEMWRRRRLLNTTLYRLTEIRDWIRSVERREGLLKQFQRLLAKVRGRKPEVNLSDLESRVDAVSAAIDEMSNISYRIGWFDSLHRLAGEPHDFIDQAVRMAWESSRRFAWPIAKTEHISPGVALDFIMSLAIAELDLSKREASASVSLSKAVLAACRSVTYLRAMASAGLEHRDYDKLFVNGDAQKARAVQSLFHAKEGGKFTLLAIGGAEPKPRLEITTPSVRACLDKLISACAAAGESIIHQDIDRRRP